jgi:hypothetical protein
MAINKQQLKNALSTINKDEEGYFCSGHFVDLLSHVHINVAMGAKLHELYNYLQFVNQDIWNIETIALRLEWQRDLWTQNKIGDGSWMQSAATDIDHFHVEFRSIFDYLAKIIGIVSKSPRQVRSSSFRKLKNWVAKSDDNVQMLGKDLAQVIISWEWFDDFREVRDSIVHRGGFTIAFLEKGRILFQVYEGIHRKVLIPEIMFNENVVDFELYAGLYIGYLIACLEEISELIYKRLNLKKVGSNPKSYHPGLRVVRDWIKHVLRYDYKNVV